MTTRLRVGYVPLTDAALLHVAKAREFADARGIELELVRETSWANIRDKLVLGHFEAAHMLAPAAIAASLGLGQMAAPLVAPVALGLNGNAITVSTALYEALRQAAEGDLADPRVSAAALARLVAERRAAGAPPLTFGHVFPFSSHHYQLRLWARAGGLDPDEDIGLNVVPPPYTVETLRKGLVDGFCVGAPWNSVAVAAGVGVILHAGTEIVRNCPEKVLAFRADWAASNEDSVRRLAAAIGDASAFAADPRNREALVAILAGMTEPAVSAETIEGVLGISASPAHSPPKAATGLRLDPAAIRAQRPHALWLFAQMVAAGQVAHSPQHAEAAAAVYVPALGPSIEAPNDMPSVFEGPPFSPDDVTAYVAALERKPKMGR